MCRVPTLLLGLCLLIGIGVLATFSAPAHSTAPTKPNAHIGINPWQPQAFLANVASFAGTNAGSIRIDLRWQEVEPRPGVFDWAAVDKVVDAATANRIDVLLTLRAISNWGTTSAADRRDPYRGASLPRDMQAWEAYLFALALRYKGRNVAYEIENEPNSDFWNGTMQDYLALIRASYSAIVHGDPQARVLSGALACHIALDFADADTLKKQNDLFDSWQLAILATHAFNTIGIHDYYFPDREVNGWIFSSYLMHIQDLARQSECEQCRLWVTETGYVSRPRKTGARIDPGSPQNQARWAAQAFDQAFDLGAERMYWLFLKDHTAGTYFDSMGLYDADGNPRPALRVLTRR
jgi:Cellulase (glycosyl hydrolase family 5)